MTEIDVPRKNDRRGEFDPNYPGDERRKIRKDRRTERNLKLVTFYIGDDLFGIDINRVQEIVIDQEVFAVPLSDPAVSGLSNLRGQVLSVFDIRNVLEYQPYPEKNLSVGIVIQSDEQPVIFRVDRQGDYLEISDSFFYSPPRTISTLLQNTLTGICQMTDQQLLMVLDSNKVIGK